ncbi:MAG: tRNA pseudouridine(13) synthase TruD, partial [Candidatus Aenigmarchaeota archaeon]|nr:tRNA pseudouridine(13) synthase TruD [Candidatus Aenigmarchaeota archaeon]
MDNYITLRDNQVAGEIKRKPDDFVVKEIICENIVCDEIQKYSDSDENEAMIFLMKLNNWDQFKAISYIASITGINKSCISFSGTKDKFAVTSQLISVDISSGVSYKDVENLGVKDIELTYLGKGSRLHIGKLWGNRFQI